MLHPLDQMALSQARHSELLNEAKIVRLVASGRTTQSSRLRQWTGSSLIWVGARLVDWGISMALSNRSRRFEIAG